MFGRGTLGGKIHYPFRLSSLSRGRFAPSHVMREDSGSEQGWSDLEGKEKFGFVGILTLYHKRQWTDK
jgi:hypothetical protein